MMLEGLFYRIINSEVREGHLNVQVRIKRDHALYAGHFPGRPVTPGVVQIQMVREILEGYLGRELRITQLRQCKFLKVIDPDVNQDLEFSLRISEDETITVQASGSCEGGVFLKLSADYVSLPK